MLVQFSVSNFMSLKEEAVLSMAADGTDREHPEGLLHPGKETLLPVAAVYGANAAGKSNLFRAMAAAIRMIRRSESRQVGELLMDVVPFLFDEQTKRKPTRFEFIFYAAGTKYQYGFSATQRRIVDEYLYEYKTARPSKIFERTQTTSYAFTRANEREFRAYVGKNTENKLLLSTATAWNCQKTKDAYLWFSEGMDVYDVKQIREIGLEQIRNGDAGMETFLLRTLMRADFNIDGYHFDARDIPEEDLQRMPPSLTNLLKGADMAPKGKRYEIATQHTVRDADGNPHAYALPFGAESNGTQRMFFFAALMKRVLEHGKTMVVDEIDIGLHPVLVKFLLSMFLDRTLNMHGAQLIFTTHDVSLLSLKLFRRDQIYFVEKEARTGASTVYSLDEFSPRKTENIRKGYLQGRYGAIPVICQEDLAW